MNRRKFLGGAFAVSVGTGVLFASSDALPKGPPRNSSDLPDYSTFTHDSNNFEIKLTGSYPVSLCSSPAHRMHQEALSKWLAEKVDAEAFKMMTRKI